MLNEFLKEMSYAELKRKGGKQERLENLEAKNLHKDRTLTMTASYLQDSHPHNTHGDLHQQLHSSGVEWSLVLSGGPNGCVPTDCGLTPRRRTSCGVRPADGVSTLTTLS